jgi:polyhydroxybutyrate depolymerase
MGRGLRGANGSRRTLGRGAQRRREVSAAALALGVACALAAAVFAPETRRAGAATTSARTVVAGGVGRTYRLHVPAHPTAAILPLVLVFHGGGGTGAGAERMYGFDRLADAQSFIVAYPDGLGRRWNDERGEPVRAWRRTGPPDDVGFVSALIDSLAAALPVDRHRVYATGISNGAILSHLLACRLSEKIAAIGPVAGTIARAEAPRCAPRRPVSVIEFHGTEDRFVPIGGGNIMGRPAAGAVLSVADTAALWARLDGCRGEPVRADLAAAEPADPTRVRRLSYGSCREGTAVAVYTIAGGGHTWPGTRPVPLLGALLGPVTRQVNATEVIWEFFAAHGR